MNGIFRVPLPTNEPVRSYVPGSPERNSLKARLEKMLNHETKPIIGQIIGERDWRYGELAPIICPHEHKTILGHYYKADKKAIEKAIKQAKIAFSSWANTRWEDRAAIFLKATELLAGPWRDTLNAATMLNQSKTCHQAEIDAACELIDFLRFNVAFAEQIYQWQPHSSAGTWNQMDYRPLEGYVFASTPFNFTSIAGNLPTAPAIMGNVVLWHPASTAVLSGYYFMKILEEAGLPPGVINFLPGSGQKIGEMVLSDPDLAGVHFTGSTQTFEEIWKTVGMNISKYKTYPRLVGETGGKDFIFAHCSANIDALVTAIIRGKFEYGGEKCSAVDRAYIARSIWSEVRKKLLEQVAELKMGSPLDFRNFLCAVIDKSAFDRIMGYINFARNNPSEYEILIGGKGDDSTGYFIEPTVILTTNPRSRLMQEEIFGPVLTIYVYDDTYIDGFTKTLEICDNTSLYGLTGAIFAQDRQAIKEARKILRFAAGNFYIDDKPTGAIVDDQPFGGGRKSGTDDKAGSPLNLIRWTSPRAIKENFCPPSHYFYPFMADE